MKDLIWQNRGVGLPESRKVPPAEEYSVPEPGLRSIKIFPRCQHLPSRGKSLVHPCLLSKVACDPVELREQGSGPLEDGVRMSRRKPMLRNLSGVRSPSNPRQHCLQLHFQFLQQPQGPGQSGEFYDKSHPAPSTCLSLPLNWIKVEKSHRSAVLALDHTTSMLLASYSQGWQSFQETSNIIPEEIGWYQIYVCLIHLRSCLAQNLMIVKLSTTLWYLATELWIFEE